MKTTITIAFAMLTGSLLAQDSAKPPDSAGPLSWGGFENAGSATFGYRFTDVSGYQPKFQDVFNLRQGPRLLDLSLFGKAQDAESRFADDNSLTPSGLGGHPFTAL